ncbi:MAG: hypothetical protein QM750_19825 [Rubrivivax sp.]
MTAMALAPRRRCIALPRPWLYSSRMQTVRSGRKTAVKFVTPSGVTAVVATSVASELMSAMRRKLECKLRRSGHLPSKARPSANPAATSS